MKRWWAWGLVVGGMGFSMVQMSLAEDLTGRLGVMGIAQAGIPVGSKDVRREGDLGVDVGGMLRYHLSKHLGIGVAYENIHLQEGYRVEPITLNLLWSFLPENRLTPVLQLGGGVSSNYPDKRSLLAPAAKAALGLEYFVNSNFVLGPQANYTYVADRGPNPHGIHALGLGMTASYFFGDGKSLPPPGPAVTPKRAAVSIGVSPAQATLGPGQTQTLSAKVQGSSNGGVTWSLDPPLGTLSDRGVYTAPATIAFAQDVVVTATSQADPSQSARSVIRLTPPADAPQQVSMEIKVLFDTGKDLIKPEYAAEVQKVADFMKRYSRTRAEIEGHTDSMGSSSMNDALSQRRANAVRQMLVEQFGIAADRLTARGYGAARPVADNATAQGRAANRRVVATISATQP